MRMLLLPQHPISWKIFALDNHLMSTLLHTFNSIHRGMVSSCSYAKDTRPMSYAEEIGSRYRPFAPMLQTKGLYNYDKVSMAQFPKQKKTSV